MKVEIISGEAKIWLQGGDISKARKMVEEVIQKATHGEWSFRYGGVEEGLQASLIMSPSFSRNHRSSRRGKIEFAYSAANPSQARMFFESVSVVDRLVRRW